MSIDEVLNEKEAAKFLNVSLSAVRKWRLEGRGPTVTRVEGAVRYMKSDLASYLKSKRDSLFIGTPFKRRSVRRDFWRDNIIEELSAYEKLLVIYFATCRMADSDGLLEVSLQRISFDTGIPESELQAAIGNLNDNFALSKDQYPGSNFYNVRPAQALLFGK